MTRTLIAILAFGVLANAAALRWRNQETLAGVVQVMPIGSMCRNVPLVPPNEKWEKRT